MEIENKITRRGSNVDVTLDVYIFPEDDCFIAYSPALDLSGYGRSEAEAKESFAIVIGEYISYAVEHHSLVRDLREHGWNLSLHRCS